MSPLKAWAAAILALSTGPLADRPEFTPRTPEGVPSVRGWERITGDFEFETPRLSVQYEFYVNPARPAVYEVVRYRIVEMGAVAESRRYAVTEKLQWDRDGRDLRRFECVPRAGGGCSWREMEKGGKDYLREVPVLLWLYGLHRNLSLEPSRPPEAKHLAAPGRVLVTAPSGG